MYWTAHQKHVDFEYTCTFVNNFMYGLHLFLHIPPMWEAAGTSTLTGVSQVVV